MGAPGLGKTSNEYARLIERIDAPKTVWMAIAFSLAQRICGGAGDPATLLYAEWQALHDNGIVPQRPRRSP